MVRMPDGMRDEIATAAKAAGRSMNSELVLRLRDGGGAQPTLRQRYAGHALAGLLASPVDGPAGTLDEHVAHYARVAFAYADGMLAFEVAEGGDA